MIRRLSIIATALLIGIQAWAQEPQTIEFCDRAYKYGVGHDTIKVYFNLLDDIGERAAKITDQRLDEMLYFMEDGREVEDRTITRLNSGVRIPRDFTFSILLYQGIPQRGKKQIFEAVEEFVKIAPDSSIYISLYGDGVSRSEMATTDNLANIKRRFMTDANDKKLYSALYAKLAEFSPTPAEYIDQVEANSYAQNQLVSDRATSHPGKNILMVFADDGRPDIEDLDFIKVTDYQGKHSDYLPKVNAFYYKSTTSDDDEYNIETLLKGLTEPKDSHRQVISALKGQYAPSTHMSEILEKFATAVEEATYDYELVYTATPGKVYSGNVDYTAHWGRETDLGSTTYTIGSAEHPWPDQERSTLSFLAELLVAIMVTVVTFMLFYLITKGLIPYIQSVSFKSKYYKKYKADINNTNVNVQKRICTYCRQQIMPNQVVVARCKHLMHRHCWEENGYRCAEYGQNCKDGIQSHVTWRELLSWNSIKECSQTMAGVLAGLVSWIIYELLGRGAFGGLSEAIVGLVFNNTEAQTSIVNDCVTRTSSFLIIGLLLGFFISIVFRYKDDIRNKNMRVWLKIIGLSLLTAAIGMLAFAIGADIMCLILSWTGLTYIPWYCSLPAYVLFSVSVSLALTIKSTIPLKSALLGGLCSAAIGFLVLYFTHFASGTYSWLNILLAFIIYGGGLGASIVTVRMLAERYFLVIQNGVKQGHRIPIHKWMSATGGSNKVTMGMAGSCEIQLNWEKSNKVAKEHARLYIDQNKNIPVIMALAVGVVYNNRVDLPINRASVLSNGDTFKIGDTVFKYEEA